MRLNEICSIVQEEKPRAELSVYELHLQFFLKQPIWSPDPEISKAAREVWSSVFDEGKKE